MTQDAFSGQSEIPTSNTDHVAKSVEPSGSAPRVKSVKSVRRTITPEAIVKTVVQAGANFFRDDLGRAYVSIPCQEPMPHRENWPLSYKSKTCRRLLRSLIPTRRLGNLRRRCFREAIDLMEAMAADSTQEITLANRISRSHDGSVLIDVADLCWKEIHVSEKGWSIQSPDTSVFRRHKHQRALPTPVSGGDINRLFDFVPTAESKDRILILAWLVSALVPDVMTPIMLRIGQPGGAKTTTSTMLRSLIDPSTTEILGEADRGQLIQVMFHHAIPCFDNLGRFGRNDADFFCRAVTGVGFEKRQLFTDMDEVLLKFKRSIILNGVTLPTTRPDFLDRSLVFHVDRLTSFRPRNEVQEEFRRATPQLLGSLLDLLVETLKLFPNTPVSTEFRMADFARLGRAVARALKMNDCDFDNAYRSTLQLQAVDALDSDSFAYAVVSRIRKEPFEGTASDFLATLKKFASDQKLEHSDKTWPGGPRWVTTRLTELAPVLSIAGIRFKQLPRQNDARNFRLSVVKEDAADAVAASSTAAGLFPRTERGREDAKAYAQRLAGDTSIFFDNDDCEGPLNFILPEVDSVIVTRVDRNEQSEIDRVKATPFLNDVARMFLVGLAVVVFYGPRGELAGLYADSDDGFEQAKEHGMRLAAEVLTKEHRRLARRKGLPTPATVRIMRQRGKCSTAVTVAEFVQRVD